MRSLDDPRNGLDDILRAFLERLLNSASAEEFLQVAAYNILYCAGYVATEEEIAGLVAAQLEGRGDRNPASDKASNLPALGLCKPAASLTHCYLRSYEVTLEQVKANVVRRPA